ncbi:hypothetical protein E3V55_01815 [Candidatus Marinimicrobia bacterium MT.SAG.3]|nr:hypothetical protein E3V55_01815 [Candidatus Marinimicrobia bacterium MT.SAG.3]
MSYAIRNTLVLFAVLLLLLGGGWGWLNFQYGDTLSKLDAQLEIKEARVIHLETILADYDYMQDKLTTTLQRWKFYPKVLLQESSVHETYRYLESISSRRASFDYEFKLSSIEDKGDIVYANYQLKGIGRYSNIYRFIQYLENSKPLYKIESLELSRPSGSRSSQGDVDVTLKFKGMFASDDKTDLTREGNQFELASVNFSSGYDPFKPFILNILPPNTENLLEIERAKVIAIMKGVAYIQGRSGEMKTMRVGDRVYLGVLEKIDLRKREVIFFMNRGGIFEKKTLRLEN